MTTTPATTEGVAFTTLQINAASPDLITAVMKKVTEEVMKAIPEGAIEKIAKEVLSSNAVVIETIRRSPWGRDEKEVKEHVLSNIAKEHFLMLVKPAIEARVRAYFEQKETLDLVHDMVAAGIKKAFEEFPAFAANIALQRLGHTVMQTPSPITDATIQDMHHLSNRIDMVRHILDTKGVAPMSQTDVPR